MSEIQRSRREFLADSAKAASFAVIAGTAATTVSAQTASNPIVSENQKTGSPEWEIYNPSLSNEIAGFASRPSIKKGSSISFYCSTAEPYFYAQVFRLGWYGGLGGCEYSDVYTFTGKLQTTPAPDANGMVECKWTAFGTLTIPTTWTNGLYVVKMTASNSGTETYIPFVVYDERAADYLYQVPVTTWQAYNNYGGKSLYDFNSTSTKRAYKVSFNRPYAQGWGAGYLIAWDICILRYLEKEGFDVNYCSNYETHASTTILPKVKSAIIGGHDEYWTRQMRNNFNTALTKKVNIAFFAANSAFWQVRYETSAFNGNQNMVCYKSAALDPYSRVTSQKPYTTVLFKDPLVALPEGKLCGGEYFDYDVSGDIVVENASHWIYTGTGLTNGARLIGLIGVECDRITSNSPTNVVRLGHSPVVGAEAGAGFSDMTIWSHTSGAMVFNAGTITWGYGLDNYDMKFGLPDLVNPAVQRITKNILNKFAGRTV